MRYGVMTIMGILVVSCAANQSLPQPAAQPVLQAQPLVESYRVVEDDGLVLAATGDMMLGGSAKPWLEKQGYAYAFAGTRHLYQDADILLGNLETPLTHQEGISVEKKYRFRNPPETVAPALREAGFDIVTLANNHSMDSGVEGLKDTMTALEQNSIRYHGAGMNAQEARRAVVLDVINKASVGFLAYTNTFPEEFWAARDRAGTAFGHVQHVREDVQRLQAKADIVVVSFHWGRESTTEIQSYQILLAHAAIDAGADVVLGHHPHVMQAIERYKQGVILYSLGNYTFGTFSNQVRYSVIARLHFKDKRFDRLEMTPININNFQIYFQPVVLSGVAAEQVFDELQRLSLQRQTQLKYANGIIYLSPDAAIQQ